MRMSRVTTMVMAFGASAALALPVAAQPDDEPGTPARDAENPVEHCLPDDGEDEDENGDNGADSDETGDDVSGAEENGDGENGDEAGDPQDAVAQCILESLPDIVGNTHAESIVTVVENGIAHGQPDGTFGPEEPVTREQMASFLARGLELEASEDAELPADVDEGSTHAESVAAIVEAAISQGREDGSFGPREPVTRGQMSSFLVRGLEL